MIVIRLIRWALRCKDIPTGDYGSYRVPTLGEAITGVSMT